MKNISLGLVLLALIASSDIPAVASPLGDARSVFEKFVAAQNAHDSAGVSSMLWQSPDFLWVSRGVQIRGSEGAMNQYRRYYQGTWHLEPDMSLFSAVELTEDVIQILVPIVFTRGDPGQPSQQSRFLISQTLLREASGWHIASVLPIADTALAPATPK